MKTLLCLATALLLPFLAHAKDKDKILDIEKDSEKTTYRITVTASYSAPTTPNIQVGAEFSYEDQDGNLYFGSTKNTSYHYSTRGSEKWATYKFEADFSTLPKGKISGFYVDVMDKSGKVADEEGWKVSKAKHVEWQTKHQSAKPLSVKQVQ